MAQRKVANPFKWYLLSLRKYFVLRGRACRQEYGIFIIISVATLRILEWIFDGTTLDILALLYALLILIPSWTVTVRRLHDVGKSGWWIILFPFTDLIACVMLLISVLGLLAVSYGSANSGTILLFYAVVLVSAGFLLHIPFRYLLKESEPTTNKYGPITTQPDLETPAGETTLQKSDIHSSTDASDPFSDPFVQTEVATKLEDSSNFEVRNNRNLSSSIKPHWQDRNVEEKRVIRKSDGRKTDKASVQKILAAILVAVTILFLIPSKAHQLQISCDQQMWGDCYHLGFLKKDENQLDEAKKLFELACKNKIWGGCNQLGLRAKVEENYNDAKGFFTLACDNEYWAGCYNLGMIAFETPNGETEEARRYLSLACERQYSRSCCHWATIEKYHGSESENRRAATIGCALGDGCSCSHLGLLEKAAGNLLEARKLFSQGCEKKDGWSCANLSTMEKKAGNHEEANRLLAVACANNHPSSCQTLNESREKAAKSLDEKRQIWQGGCAKGDTRYCSQLADIEWDAGNINRARELYATGCHEGISDSCLIWAQREANAGNFQKAKRLNQVLCDNGGSDSSSGCINLGISE